MPFYLSEYIGAGTHQDPFRPVGADQPGWSGIDLRPDASRADGGGLNACLFRVPTAFTDARARFLADDKLETLTNPQRNFLANKLGVDLGSSTLLRDIIATLMTSPPANGWKGILPGRLRWEIWLGELIWQAPRASGGATDTFNRANETPIASPWTQQPSSTGTMNLTSNAMISASDGDKFYYYSGAATSADQYSQFTITFASIDGGPAVRIGSSGLSGYWLAIPGDYAKHVAGAYTDIGNHSGSYANGNTARIECEGTTIRAFKNGSPTGTPSVTDSSLTTAGNGAGAFIFASFGTDSVDNFDGADLTPPPVQELRPDADIVTTGWATAPLWSKIEETSADATVITATAS